VTGLLGATRTLLDDAVATLPSGDGTDQVAAARRRLDDPLRVAFAGRLKAGKSTLLNALIGERLAATDATECTRVVTWYVAGPAVRAWAYPADPGRGPARQLRFGRADGRTHIDLGTLRPEDLDRLVVETPNSRLHRLQLVDTPGLASSSIEVSARTATLLSGGVAQVDAVIYLMRHVHVADVGFLQSFHDDAYTGVPPVNAIGVLSRADELAGGAANALDVAGTIAARYAGDDRVRALVQGVVPVSGLLALAAVELGEADYATLRMIAGAPAITTASAGQFQSANLPVPAEVRQRLLADLGLFGIRRAVGLIRMGRVHDATSLSDRLKAECGLERLRGLLAQRFLARAEVLKAEAGLRTLEAVLTGIDTAVAGTLAARAEALVAGAHELTELRMLTALRTGVVELSDPDLLTRAERVLGAEGVGIRDRLALPPDAPDEELRPRVIATLRQWQRAAQDPFTDAGTRRVAAVIRRTCEGML
jgi:hypothetical protein